MNQLRQLMLEELHRRNFADTTIRTYLHGVEHFIQYFRRRPDQLCPEDIRKYQAALFPQFSPNTVILRLTSLRFFYIHVLKRNWSIAETPYPKKLRHLPGVLSQQEVARLKLQHYTEQTHWGFSGWSSLKSKNQACQFPTWLLEATAK